VVLSTTGSPLLLSDIEVVAGRYGQPQAAVLRPGTPGGRVLVSISHSGNAAVAVGCAEVHAAGIGVDIEVCRARPGVERKGLTAAELSRLEHVPESMRTETVLRWWCAKEAAAKALGLGLHRSGGAHRIEVTELRPDSSRLAVAVPSVAGGPARVLHAVTRRDGDVVLAAVVNARSGVHQRGSAPALRLG
jgi:phosphopantetheinyl transferase